MEQCTCNPRKHGTFFINGRLICIYCRKPVEDAANDINPVLREHLLIADLEAANILLNNTINVQLQVIREHEAADVIAVEAIRAQEAELKFYRNQFPTAAKNWAKVATSTNVP